MFKGKSKIVTRDPLDSVASWAGRFDRQVGHPPLIENAIEAGFPATAIETVKNIYSSANRSVKSNLKAKLTEWCETNLPLANFFVDTYSMGVMIIFSTEEELAFFKLCFHDEYEISLNSIGAVK